MAGLSEVATYVYAGGQLESKPEYDYTLFLPLLVYRDGDLDKLAKFDKRNEIMLAKEVLTLDLEAVKYQAQNLYTRRVETNRNCAQLCLGYKDMELFNKAGLIYQLYITSNMGYGSGNRFNFKDIRMKEAFATLVSTPETERELRYILHLILFYDQHPETLSNLTRLFLVGQPPMELAMSFIASNLLEFEQVLSTLLCAYRANIQQQSYISGWLLAILSTFPYLAETIGFQLSSWKVSPGMIRSVPFISLSFQLTFLNSLLNSHAHSPLLGQSESKPDVGQVSLVGSIEWLKDRSVDVLAMSGYFQKLFDAFLKAPASSDLPQLCGFLRVMTSFKMIYSIKLGVAPLVKMFGLLKTYLPRDDAPRSFLDLCLCFVLIAGQEFLQQKQAKDALGEMMEGLFNFHFEAIVHIVTAARCNNLEVLGAYYVSILGFRFRFDDQLISRIKGLFGFAVFGTQTLADRICSVTSVDYSVQKVPQCQANQKISYLLGCGIKLLRDESYLEHRLDIQTWVCSLLTNLTSLPIHPFLPALIKEYVTCVTQDNRGRQLTKIHERVLTKHLHSKHDDWGWEAGPKEILFLYYALLYNERLAELSPSSPDFVSQLRYSDSFYDQIPVKRIMLFVDKNNLGPGMDEFKAEFCGLVRSTFAHFFCVTSTLFVNKFQTQNTPGAKYPTLHELKDLLPSDSIQEALHEAFKGAAENPLHLQLLLDFLKAQPSHVLLNCADKLIRQGIPAILNQNLGQGILDAYFEIWNLINNLVPEILWPLTVNSAQFLPGSAWVRLRDCSLQDLFEDPLLLSRLNPNFFRIPQLFNIFITMMDSVSNASRSRFQRIQRYRTLKQKALFGLDEVRSMLQLQDTAVIQMVLELCQAENHKDSPENISAIRRMAFNFVHLQFVETPLFIKLVHFQTYPLDLVALAVENIPSIFVVMDFLGELLLYSDPAVHWFGLLLSSHVLAKYPLPSSMALLEKSIVPCFERLVAQFNVLVVLPNPDSWEAHIAKLFGEKNHATIATEMNVLRWLQSNLDVNQLNSALLRIATTFPHLAIKFLSWFKPQGIIWEAHQLKAGLEAILLSEENRPSKRVKVNL